MIAFPTIPLSDERVFRFRNGLWKGKKPPYILVNVLRSTNFTKYGELDYSNVAEIEVEARAFEPRRLRCGDIILERSGGGPAQPVGRVGYFGQNDGLYCFSNFTSSLRIEDLNQYWPKYVHYFLLNYHIRGGTEHIQSHTTGIRNLDFNSYKKIRIPCPPLPEQKKIASILAKIWKAVEVQASILENLRELKKSLMNRLFTQGLRGEPLKKTVIGMMPKSWSVKGIGECYCTTSKPRGLRYSDYQSIPFLTMQDIPVAGTRIVSWQLKSPSEISSGTYFECSDLLVAKITPCFENGKQVLATGLPASFGVATTEVIPLQEIKGRSSAMFLSYYLLIPEVRTMLAGKMEGTTGRQRLSKSLLLGTPMPFPPLEEQTAIVGIMQSLDSKTELHQAKKSALEDLFKATLNQLMTGKIRVKDLDIATSEVEIA